MTWPDVTWYRDVNTFARRTPALHAVLANYALWGGLVLLAGLLIGGYLIARHRPDAPRGVARVTAGGIAVVAALLVNQHLLSPAVARPRPCHTLHGAEVLLSCANDYSFPSDHCVLAGGFTVALFAVGWRWGTTAVGLSLLLAFTRVYTGVHYPSDAAVGLLFGAAVAVLVLAILTRPLTALARRLRHTPLSSLITASSP